MPHPLHTVAILVHIVRSILIEERKQRWGAGPSLQPEDEGSLRVTILNKAGGGEGGGEVEEQLGYTLPIKFQRAELALTCGGKNQKNIFPLSEALTVKKPE